MSATAAVVPRGTESARDQLERRNWSASSGTTRDSPLFGEPSSAAASSPPPGAIAVGASSVSNQDVLVPAVSAALERGDVRLLYVLGEEFDSDTAGAVWADTKMFAGHPRGWEKVAVVSVADWLENSIKAFGWYRPGKVRIFDTDDVDDGLARLTGGGSDRDDD